MLALQLLLPGLALLVLAAHFYRAGLLPLGALSVALIGLLFVPRRWAAVAAQIALLVGALEWLRTLAALVATRVAAGQPYVRLAVILLAVALLTAAAALVFRSATARARFRR